MSRYHVVYKDRQGDQMRSSLMSREEAESRAVFLKTHSLAEIGSVEIVPDNEGFSYEEKAAIWPKAEKTLFDLAKQRHDTQ